MMCDWLPYAAIGLAFMLGMGLGALFRWGVDRAELEAYRRISRSLGGPP